MPIDRIAMRLLAVLAAALLWPALLLAQERGGVSEELLGGVVKITSRAPGGPERTGTGFIVRVDRDMVYIATASHVIEGDSKPQVAFYHDKRRPLAADVGALEGGDPKGLAYLIVRDWEVASRVKALNWSADRQSLSRGEDVIVIGFGQGQGEWGVIRGSVASIAGSDIRIDGRIESGNSGGPIIKDGNVAGMVTSMNQGFGIGKSGIIVITTLAGWDVPVSTAVTRPGSPAPATRPAVDPQREVAAAPQKPAGESSARPPLASPAPGVSTPMPRTTPPAVSAAPSAVAAPDAAATPSRAKVSLPKGDRYEGEMLGNKREGQGIYFFVNGDRYEGTFRDDLMTGRGVFRYANGDRYEGEFVNGEFSGKGVLFLANGDRYEGVFRANAKNGRGVHYFENGARYEGEFANGLQNGNGTHYYKNGDRYSGQFRDGVRNGKGVYTFANGSTRPMEFVNGEEKK